MNSSFQPQLFDVEGQLQVVDRRLPHWSQPGAIAFITWRTFDSMPRAILDQWHGERARLLRECEIDPDDPEWRRQLNREKPEVGRSILDRLWNRWQLDLDAGHGACALRRADLARIVADSLLHFDGVRYLMLDFVVMPNHVHVLVCFPDDATMLTQCESWKHFTATQINRRLKLRGRFWQQEAFDHLVRTEAQLQHLREYVARNPEKSGLNAGEFVHYTNVTYGTPFSSSRGA